MKNGVKKTDKRNNFTYWVVDKADGSKSYRKKVKKPNGKVTTATADTLAGLKEAVRKIKNETPLLCGLEQNNLTCGQLADLFLESFKRQNPPHNTVKRKESLVRAHFKPVLETMRIAKLTPILLENLAAPWFESNRSKEIIRTAKEIFHFAVKRRLMAYNPAEYLEGARPQKKPEKRNKFLTPAEVAQLVAFLDEKEPNTHNLRFRLLIVFLLNSGLRISEALAIKWEDIDLLEKTVLVCKKVLTNGEVEHFTKSKQDRLVPLGNYIIGELKKWKAHQAKEALRLGQKKTHLFECPYSDHVLNIQSVACKFRRVVTASGIPYCSLHDLRHTYGSTLAAKRVDVTQIQKRMGHSSPKVTQDFYIHASKEKDTQAEDVLDTLFNQLNKVANGS